MDLKNYAVIAVGLLIFTGCSSYYQITDPASGSVYFSKSVKDKRGGAVTFEDAQTGGSITLQSSEILEISKDSFKEGVAGKDQPAEEAPAEAASE